MTSVRNFNFNHFAGARGHSAGDKGAEAESGEQRGKVPRVPQGAATRRSSKPTMQWSRRTPDGRREGKEEAEAAGERTAEGAQEV